jgi:uncharacterized membrane protein
MGFTSDLVLIGVVAVSPLFVLINLLGGEPALFSLTGILYGPAVLITVLMFPLMAYLYVVHSSAFAALEHSLRPGFLRSL